MNLKPVFASLCAMSCVAIPMSASAQDYYARQKIEKLEPAQTSSPAPAPAPSATPTPIPTPEVTYAWREGAWSNWSSECSDEATRFRNVICVASTNTVAAPEMCPGTMPETTQTGSKDEHCPPPAPPCDPGIVKSLTGQNLAPEGEQGFNLVSLGRTTDTRTPIWMVRNTTDLSRNGSIRVGQWVMQFVSPPKSDLYFYSGDNGSGRMTILNENARVLTVQTVGVSSGFYPDCS